MRDIFQDRCWVVHIPFVSMVEFASTLVGNIQWNLRDSKSLRVSRTLLSILADVNNIVVCTALIWPPFQVRQLQLVLPSPLCSIAFLYFFFFFGKVYVLVSFFVFFFFSLVHRDSKFHNSAGSLGGLLGFLLIITKPGLLAVVR